MASLVAYWAQSGPMYANRQSTPLPETAGASLLAAKEIYRKGRGLWGHNLLICTLYKTDGAGGRNCHARPLMGKARPAQVFDSITRRSWANGERTTKEHAAYIRARAAQPETAPVYAGPASPDVNYFPSIQTFDGSHTINVQIHRDEDDFPGA